jgi:hypothetical protein
MRARALSLQNSETTMKTNHNLLYALVAILGITAIGASYAYVQERDRKPGLEIRVDQNGLKVEGK